MLFTAAYLPVTWSAVRDFVGVLGAAFGVVAAAVATWTYHKNSARQRAQWAVQLYEKFYESDRYRKMRDALDCESDSAEISELVSSEGPEFTDYLNFFELMAYLSESKQVSRTDILALFDYYLRCMKRHPAVMSYIENEQKGFERLGALLREL